MTERVVQSLNRALHGAFGRYEGLFLLGEDVVDPYGGAFKVTQGLSTAYPERVLATPLSEAGIVGMANGLAMQGHRVIVEIMFGDFLGLAFDQILNLTSKSVAMYGRRYPMPVVVRCPVGGRRGYGPTHSQSPQKHFIGIPHLALYELSPFHDVDRLLTELLERDEPSILFEDKVTYTERIVTDGGADQRHRLDLLGDGNWAHLHSPADTGRPRVVLIASGGVGRRALSAATELSDDDGLDVHVLVPARLYPLDVDDVLDLLVSAKAVWVAEESTAGGTWGAEVAARVHHVAWGRLRAPVRSVSSADSVIPAATHLEQEVLLQADTIVAAVRGGVRTSVAPPPPGTRGGPPAGQPVLVPTLNSLDDSYVLVGWLVGADEEVRAGQPVAEVETTKTTSEVVAETTGTLRHLLAVGAECLPGEAIGLVGGSRVEGSEPTGPAPTPATDTTASTLPLSRSQRQVADVVTASHRDIPAAFMVVRIVVDEVLAATDRLASRSGAEIGLAEVALKALGELRAEHPLLYGTLEPEGTVRLPSTVHVGVTVDVGTGLSIPVVADVAAHSVDEIADALTDLRMRALREHLVEADLTGASIAVSLNTGDGIVMVQPIVPPGLGAILSLAAVHEQPWPDGRGGVRLRRSVDVVLAHDHRFVNGREAAAFLCAFKGLLEQPGWLEEERFAHPPDTVRAGAPTSDRPGTRPPTPWERSSSR